MIKVAPAGQKDAIEMRKIYAGFVAKQIEAGSEIIALEADLMSSMAMDGVARDYPQHVINCGIMEANDRYRGRVVTTYRKPFVHTLPRLPAVAASTSCLCPWTTSVIT